MAEAQVDVAPAPKKRQRQRQRKTIYQEEKVEGLRLPSAPEYMQLLDFEKRIDAVLTKRKSQVLESIRRTKTESCTLRVFVFCSSTSETWTLHIHGRILSASEDNPLSEQLARDPPFSSFLKRLEVDIDGYTGDAAKVCFRNESLLCEYLCQFVFVRFHLFKKF